MKLQFILASLLSFCAAWLKPTKWTRRSVSGVPLRSLVSDSALTTSVDESGATLGGNSEEQPFETAFMALCAEEDPEIFTATLKLWASKRAMFTNEEKSTLIDSTLAHMENLNADLLSSCVWSLGIIGYTIDQTSKPSNKMNSKSSTGAFMLPKSTVSKMMADIDRVTSIPSSTESLCRVIGGLSKMGYQWTALPMPLRGAVIELLVSYSDRVVDGKSDDQGKDIAIMCYTLGQLKARKPDIGKNGIKGLLDGIKNALQQKSMTNQGLVNSLNGLQRMGLSWNDDIPASSGLRSEILQAALHAVESMRQDEACSLLHSLALLKVSWSKSLPTELQNALSNALEKHAPSFNNREIANAHWALGKLYYPYCTGGRLEQVLADMLVRRAHTFNQFDVESTFVGLGLMRASFADLPEQAQAGLLGKVGAQVDTMNIFKLYNVLWGMARVGLTIDAPALSKETSQKLWERTVAVFHTFLRRQHGDVMWALGSLGYSFEDMKKEEDKQRILAILTRVFTTFNTREAALVLWGLARMGVRWDVDMAQETQSLSGGDPVDPMRKIVSLYLKRQKFREKDYAVLLSSMGALGVRFNDNLSSGIVVKLSKVAPFVSSHFSSRSLVMALDGLATCGMSWKDMAGGEEVREAYCSSMLKGGPLLDSGMLCNNDNNKPQGFYGMDAAQLTKALDSLARMGVIWDSDLPISVQRIVEKVLNRERDNLSSQEADSITSALDSMKCPLLCNFP